MNIFINCKTTEDLHFKMIVDFSIHFILQNFHIDTRLVYYEIESNQKLQHERKKISFIRQMDRLIDNGQSDSYACDMIGRHYKDIYARYSSLDNAQQEMVIFFALLL